VPVSADAPNSDDPARIDRLPTRVVIVPTRAAAAELQRTLVSNGVKAGSELTFSTRDDLYSALHTRLAQPLRLLTAFERDAMMEAAALEAANEVRDLPFTVRPGLIVEIVRFYDQLRRQSQTARRFDELISDSLGVDLADRGAERLLRQTKFLARTFAGYEERTVGSGAVDEHGLRDRLLTDDAVPLAHVIVSVPDWIADPAGLFLADFDLLNRLPNLASIDLVSTERVLRSGFHERLHRWWPGIDELTSADIVGSAGRVRPMLNCPPPAADSAPLWFTRRDREEELIAVARRISSGSVPFDRTAVVYKQPLPYLYLAADTFEPAGIPFVVADALPLATEPSAAALEAVLDALESGFARAPLMALLRSPHFVWSSRLSLETIGMLDRMLSESRYLGGAERLLALVERWQREASDASGEVSGAAWQPAANVATQLVRELSQFAEPRPASSNLLGIVTFLEAHLANLDAAHPQFDRERRARAALLRIAGELAAAHAAHHDPVWRLAELTTGIRRWVEQETFQPASGNTGLRLLDDQAARYGEFDNLTIVGLVEREWPDRPRRNIFYPPPLLKSLGWPSEQDRHAAAEARFQDLLESSSARVELSTFLLDDETIVSRSILLDDVSRAGLSTMPLNDGPDVLMPDEMLALSRQAHGLMSAGGRSWLDLRAGRTPHADRAFHGFTGERPPRTWSVSALETYVGCPFKFFAQHVLRLEEEPDDEEVMDPRRQGRFVHEVFEQFFKEWQAAGHGAITPSNLPAARALFVEVVDRALESVPEGEAALERTRLLGSPAAAGLGEAVFRMEAERPITVVTRLLEHTLDGAVEILTDAGPRTIALRGKADRLDLLADGTFRLIDYKLGWPPDRSKALQLPIYAISAEQHLRAHGHRWTLGEAMYLAFKGPKRVVPLFSSDAARTEVLVRAQQRLADAVDAIGRGEFPPTPDDVYRCETCTFASVCRKDYVGTI
jgi:RecB family exonuclease